MLNILEKQVRCPTCKTIISCTGSPGEIVRIPCPSCRLLAKVTFPQAYNNPIKVIEMQHLTKTLGNSLQSSSSPRSSSHQLFLLAYSGQLNQSRVTFSLFPMLFRFVTGLMLSGLLYCADGGLVRSGLTSSCLSCLHCSRSPRVFFC